MSRAKTRNPSAVAVAQPGFSSGGFVTFMGWRLILMRIDPDLASVNIYNVYCKLSYALACI